MFPAKDALAAAVSLKGARGRGSLEGCLDKESHPVPSGKRGALRELRGRLLGFRFHDWRLLQTKDVFLSQKSTIIPVCQTYSLAWPLPPLQAATFTFIQRTSSTGILSSLCASCSQASCALSSLRNLLLFQAYACPSVLALLGGEGGRAPLTAMSSRGQQKAAGEAVEHSHLPGAQKAGAGTAGARPGLLRFPS